jgi:hypothetical protein
MGKPSSTVERRATFAALCITGMLMAACTGGGVATTVAPTPLTPAPSSSLTLTVHVHARTSESPIAGALVRHDASRFYTDASGELTITIDAGKETTVEVSAAGYHPMTATAVVNSAESWTFYLQPIT